MTKKKTWQSLTIVIVLIISTVGLGGCDIDNIPSNPDTTIPPSQRGAHERREQIGAEILAHMYEKYGVEFNIRGHDWDRYQDMLTLYPVWGTFEHERVRVNRRVINGEVSILDTYFNIIMREDHEAEVLGFLSDIDLPMKAFSHGSGGFLDNIFDGTKTFADFRREGSGAVQSLSVSIAVSYDGDRENHETIANQIFDALAEAGYAGLVHLSIFDDDELFQTLTRTNRHEIVINNHEAANHFSISISRRRG
jgi:hypothetical protein